MCLGSSTPSPAHRVMSVRPVTVWAAPSTRLSGLHSPTFPMIFSYIMHVSVDILPWWIILSCARDMLPMAASDLHSGGWKAQVKSSKVGTRRSVPRLPST
jgi:hypothetical protein